MAITTYSDKLQDPRWQRKRLEVFDRDNFTCRHCGDTKTQLHVHHNFYEKWLEPWEYDLRFLKTLCKHCHALIESFDKKDASIFCTVKGNESGKLILSSVCVSLSKGWYISIDVVDELGVVNITQDFNNKNVHNLIQLSEKLLS